MDRVSLSLLTVCVYFFSLLSKYYIKFVLHISEVQCTHPPPIKDGFIEVANFKDSYIYGSKATYHCNPGFILWGR